jgi:hypothetical protein
MMFPISMGFGYVSTMLLTPYMILCMLPWLFVVLPVLWFLKVIFEIVTVALVIENDGIVSAFKSGWQVIKMNLKDIIGIGFLLSFVDGLTSLLIGLPISILLSPLFADTVQFQELLLLLVIYFPIAWLLGSLVRASIHASWTRAYLQLQINISFQETKGIRTLLELQISSESGEYAKI